MVLNTYPVSVQGKALLWYNISPSGTEEKDILHAGCTVAVGAKWGKTEAFSSSPAVSLPLPPSQVVCVFQWSVKAVCVFSDE